MSVRSLDLAIVLSVGLIYLYFAEYFDDKRLDYSAMDISVGWSILQFVIESPTIAVAMYYLRSLVSARVVYAFGLVRR